MIASALTRSWPVTPMVAADRMEAIRTGTRVGAAAVVATLLSVLLASALLALLGYRPSAGLFANHAELLPLVGSASFLALDALVVARARRIGDRGRSHAGGPAVRFVGCDASELVARGRVVLANDGPNIAVYLFDRAIAADPTNEEAWLLKAACQDDQADRLACLQAGLTVNPASATLKAAVAYAGSA